MSSKRKYPKGCSDRLRRDIDRMSDFSAYAYGFSDEKPGASTWVVLAVVYLVAFTKILGVW